MPIRLASASVSTYYSSAITHYIIENNTILTSRMQNVEVTFYFNIGVARA